MSVMPGLVPGIHVLGTEQQGVDGRDKPGHDVREALALHVSSRSFPTGKPIPSHLNEFCPAKLICRLYWILAFVP
jgi:hypothetical protein